VLVDIGFGTVRGRVVHGVARFAGVPYARAGRFAAPRDPDGWTGVRVRVVSALTAAVTRSRVQPRMWASSLRCRPWPKAAARTAWTRAGSGGECGDAGGGHLGSVVSKAGQGRS
jgi:Carboxylesterase family